MKKYLLLVSFMAFFISSAAQITIDTEKRNTTIYAAVEIAPSFPGGEKQFANFIVKNVRYPAEDRKNRVSGKVFVQFVVEHDGSLTDIKIIHAPSETLGAEAVRVLSLSPKWQPGIQNSKPVRVQYTVPFNFSL